jgi:hypothetical protein
MFRFAAFDVALWQDPFTGIPPTRYNENTERGAVTLKGYRADLPDRIAPRLLRHSLCHTDNNTAENIRVTTAESLVSIFT